MASSLDKLLKSVDGIRSALKSNKDVPAVSSAERTSMAHGDPETSKREKMGQVAHIVDTLTASCRSPGVVVDSASVARALSPCCELLLLLCDDPDADVRLQANDGLTKCIRMLMLTHSGRIENELYKEIKKNGNARSLRAALSRFGIVAPRIRIPKRRAYAANMASSVMRICAVRGEESVWETLASFFNSVWPTLGPYFLESESRKLIKTLFGRLRDESAPLAVRRSAGLCVTAVCKFAKDSEQTSSFVLDAIADEGMKLLKEENSVLLHSCLMLMRCLLPVLVELPIEDASKKLGTSLRSPSASESSTTITSSSSDFVHSKESIRLNQYLFIYEVGLRSTQSRNPSICTAALELLQVILSSPPPFFAAALKDPGGIGSQSRLKDEESDCAWDAVSVVTGAGVGEGSKSIHEDASISVANDDMESISNFLIGSRKTGVLTTQRSEDVNNLLSKQSSLQNDSSRVNDEMDADIGDGHPGGDGTYCALPIGSLDTDENDGFVESRRLAVVDREEDEEEEKVEVSAGVVDEDFEPSLGAEVEPEEELGETLLPGKPNRTFGEVGSIHFPEPQIHFCARVVGSSFLVMTPTAAKELKKEDSTTNLVSDSVIRVSLQALSLAVLSNIARLEPRLLQLPVNIGDDQKVSATFEAVLDLTCHRDPSIRANLAALCGSIIGSALAAGLGQTAGFLGVPFTAVWEPLAEAVFDDSPVVSRAGLKAVSLVADPILRSDRAQVLLKMARQLPTLARDSSYWLVKVELLAVIAEIPTAEMEFLLKPGPAGLGETYRERCMESVILPLLSDENQKVRSAAAKALIKIAVKTPDPADVWDGSPVSASAAALTPSYREVLGKKSLSRVVTKVLEMLHQATAPETVLGSLEALAELAASHPPKSNRAAWFCTPSASPGRNCQAMGYVGLLINLTTSRAVCSDLLAVTNLVTVATMIFEGVCMEFLKPPEKDPKGLAISTRKWEALNHPQLEVVAQLLLSFLVRILCMSAACVSDTPPSKAPFSTTTSSREIPLHSPTTPTTAPPQISSLKTPSGSLTSPVKRMIKAVGGGSSGSTKVPEITSGAGSESEDSVASVGSALRLKKQSSTASLGGYSHLPEVVRLHEVVRGIYDNYKVVVSQEQRAEKKLMNFLKESFEGFGRIVEFATASEVGQNAEEILGYVQVLMPLCPAPAMKAVEQLLHCLFCSNVAAVGEKERSIGAEFLTASCEKAKVQNEEGKDPSSFYQAVFGGPYRTFATAIRGARNGCPSLGSRAANRALLIRTGPNASRTHLSNYIRLFEPIVIYSLKVFTSTPEVNIQTSVLSLLVTLIRLRVNYHLLDNEQVFLNYVLRQFELVEEGLVAGPECPVDRILPWLLKFLVLLSHDSIHSKGQSLIPFSKLIQLCDGLMASEFNKETHCLPAMGPLVEDLFIWRQNPSSKDKADEQDTQKEVVLAMLARLLPSVQVVRILTLALTGLRESGSEETYKRTSRHMLDALLPGMSKFEMNLDSVENAKAVSAFFAALSPSAYRPFDSILRLMISHPSPEKFRRIFPRWLAGVTCCLGVVIVHGNEENVLSRLIHADLLPLMCDESVASNTSDGGDLDEDDRTWVDPLGVTSPEKGSLLKKKSEEKAVVAFARFLLDTLALAGKETSYRIAASYSGASDPAVTHLVNLLMHVSHMVQSGEFRKTAAGLRDLFTTDACWEKDLHDVMVKLGFVNPLIPLYWMNLLSLLNCGRIGLWSRLLKGGSKSVKGSATTEAPCCSKEVLKRGTLVVYCDFVHENLVSSNGCGEELTWLLVNHLKALVCLHKEPPVTDLVAALNRNSVTSLLFVHAMRMRLHSYIDEPRVARGVLACLTDCPIEIGFALLELCVHVLMPARILATSYKGFRLAENTVNLITEDEERHRARSSAGSLVVPQSSATHSDYSEEEEEEDVERRRRANGRKMMRLLELQDVKVADFDALIVRCEDVVIRKRYPDFADKLRRLRILAFGTAGLDRIAPEGELRWKSFVDEIAEDGEVGQKYARPEHYPDFRRSVDGVISAALRRNDQVTVEAAAALVSGLTLDDAVERIQDEDFPMTALPALLCVEDPSENDEEDPSDALFLEQRARGGGGTSEQSVKPNRDDDSYSGTSNSTGPFGEITTESRLTESASRSLTETATTSSTDLLEGDGLTTRRLPVVKGRLKNHRRKLHIKAAVGVVVAAKIDAFLKTLPQENEVFMPTSWNPSETEMDYTEGVLEALYIIQRSGTNDGSGDAPSSSSSSPVPHQTTNVWSNLVIPLCECLVNLPMNETLDPLSIARLVLAAFEGAKAVASGDRWRRRTKSASLRWTWHDMETVVACAGTLLCRPFLWKIFADDETWTVSMIEAVFAVVDAFPSTAKVPRIETLGKELDSVKETDQGILSASIKASRLASWAHKVLQFPSEMTSLEWNLIPVVVAVCRFPSVYGFVRIPAELLPGVAFVLSEDEESVKQKFVWHERYEMPTDALHDPEVLKDYLWRLNLLGWTNRTDFEESWMALLAVVSTCVNACCGGGAGDVGNPYGDSPPSLAETAVLARAGALGLAGIAGLLRQTLLLPVPGFPFASEYRNSEDQDEARIKLGTGYATVPWQRSRHSSVNLAALDFVLGTMRLGRDSLPGSPLARQTHTGKLPTWTGPGQVVSFERKRSLQALGIDVHSCVQFLSDLLSQWTKNHRNLPPILLFEILKTKAMTLDLVTEFGQVQVLHDSFMSFKKTYATPEDELVVPYVVLGLARTTAILASRSVLAYEGGKVGEFPEPTQEELASWEVMRDSVIHALRGIPLASQVSGLQACHLLMETKWAKLLFMTTFPMLPDYLRLNLIGATMSGCYVNERHITSVWETAFTLLKDFSTLMADSDLQTQVHLVCLEVISSVDRISTPIARLIEGVMKLAGVHTLDIATRDLLIKVSSRHFGRVPLSVAVPVSSLQLVLLNTYDVLQSESCGDIAKEHVSNEISLVAQEWVNHVFGRMGTRSEMEAEEWAKILPSLPESLIPSTELVNKLLSEFISSKQGHVVQVAAVLMQILGELPPNEAIEWCLLSVGAFLQRSPLSVALWFVTTLLLSVCVAQWTVPDASLPHLTSRATFLSLLLKWHWSRPPPAFRHQDFWLVSLAVTSFLDMLKSTEQVKMVLTAFSSVCDGQDDADTEIELKPLLFGLIDDIRARMR